VAQERCLALVPRSCGLLLPGVRWLPLDPVCLYPWSLLWRAEDTWWPVAAVRKSACALSSKLGWLADLDHCG